MSDRTSSIVGAVLGVTVGGILTWTAARATVDWAIARAVKAS